MYHFMIIIIPVNFTSIKYMKSKLIKPYLIHQMKIRFVLVITKDVVNLKRHGAKVLIVIDHVVIYIQLMTKSIRKCFRLHHMSHLSGQHLHIFTITNHLMKLHSVDVNH
uniref:SJCHGC07486 protein n=1 Tax=Schistosoma japonicum TaxID=6182 RepID=Q5D9D1_SCHJA|nr:SJCHGC07486 protein [Schistosoma japonicum]